MPGYQTKQESIAVAGVADLFIRSLLDRQQFADPLGEADRLGISSATWPLFGLLWPSGAHLAAALALRPVQAGERILELGCGLALASLVGHRRGADVTASDCHPLAGAFLLENLRLNGLRPMKYRVGHWGGAAAAVLPVLPVLPVLAVLALPVPLLLALPADAPVDGLFDLIIGSDLLYERDADGELADYIARHASAAGEVWIVDPDRGNRPAFNRQMAERGFDRQEQRLGQPPPSGRAAGPAYKGRMLVYRRPARGLV
jgi:predicted nicotinamide N-methyase